MRPRNSIVFALLLTGSMLLSPAVAALPAPDLPTLPDLPPLPPMPPLPELPPVPEPPPVPDLPPAPGLPLPAGNGYVMMIHGTVVPRVQDLVPAPPFDEGLLATMQDGFVTLHAIVFSDATAAPVAVQAPRLKVAGPLHSMTLSPNAPPDKICEEEAVGYGGTPAMCYVFAYPWEFFAGNNVVDISLHFRVGGQAFEENYNALGHAMLHNYLEDPEHFPIDLRTNDQVFAQATPFVVDFLGDLSP